MSAPVTLVGPHLQRFFAEHLAVHKHASPRTVASYRDTFRLLLQFMQDTTGIAPTALPVANQPCRTQPSLQRPFSQRQARSPSRLLSLRVPPRPELFGNGNSDHGDPKQEV